LKNERQAAAAAVGDSQPDPSFVPINASLEDVYFHYTRASAHDANPEQKGQAA